MKKTLLVFLILLLFTVFASGNRESWMSGGGEFGQSRETQSVQGIKVNTTLNSIGAYINVLQFNDDKDTGIIVHDSFLLPLGGKIKIDGEHLDYSLSDADFKSYIGIMLGPVFRKSLDGGKGFYIGAGPSIQQLTASYAQGSSVISYLFGIGISTGIKIDIGEKTYWDVGLMADASFYSYTKSSAYPDGQTGNMFNLSLRPHIGIGYILKMKYE
ncbi:MAG: hypothetical protein WCS59_00610 [Sphaerochaetaceae bacterium]|nr:hypothetical protein [Sphaerochaetaceae bacterium]